MKKIFSIFFFILIIFLSSNKNFAELIFVKYPLYIYSKIAYHYPLAIKEYTIEIPKRWFIVEKKKDSITLSYLNDIRLSNQRRYLINIHYEKNKLKLNNYKTIKVNSLNGYFKCVHMQKLNFCQHNIYNIVIFLPNDKKIKNILDDITILNFINDINIKIN